jgi:hypothetical protein
MALGGGAFELSRCDRFQLALSLLRMRWAQVSVEQAAPFTVSHALADMRVY